MAFEVIVLGASGTYPTPGAACAGYLLRSNGSDVWVDSGPGTFANLQRHANFWELDGLVLSHLHPDHLLDFYPFYYALRYSGVVDRPPGFKVFAPSPGERHLTKMISFDEPCGFDGYIDFSQISEESAITLGAFEFEFSRSVHPIETLSMRITSEGRTLVYSSDTGRTTTLADVAKGAHCLICEATLQTPDEGLSEVHLTAQEAGAVAAEAGVEKLVLTHLWPGLEAEQSVEQAAKEFSGEIIVGADNLRVIV